MTETKKNIPALRFPEFEGEWEEKKLGEVLTIGSGKDYKHLNDGDIPVYGTGGYMLSVDDYLHDGETVCIGRKGTIDNPMYFKGKIWTVDTLFYTHSFKDSFPKFLFNVFQTINWKQYNEASGVPSLSKNTIENIEFSFPSLAEQQKIADFLSSVDEQIEKLNEKKTTVETYKKGIMQQLFSQEIRFKDENGNDYPDWQEKKLGEILDEHKTRNINNNVEEVFSVAKHKGVINQIEHLGRSYASDNVSNYKVVLPYDIIYTKSPTSDFPFGIIKQNKLERTGIVSVLYAVFSPSNMYIGYLLDTYFSSPVNTYNYLNPLVQKGAKNTMNISNDDFLDGAKIALPTNESEQQKIADFLSSIDELIDKCNNQIAEAQAYKKGLLQQMFV